MIERVLHLNVTPLLTIVTCLLAVSELAIFMYTRIKRA